MLIETRRRTFVKTVTWRAMSFAGMVGVVWGWTGRASLALAAGGAEALGKMALYYLHERGWTKIKFGRHTVPPAVIWITGLSGAGKTRLARELESELVARGLRVEHFDGQRIRRLFPSSGFSPNERREHIRRVGMLASILESNGTFVIASLVSPHADSRAFVRTICQRFVEVHVSTPLEVCEAEDRTGLYARARAGELKNVVGIDTNYEAPVAPEVAVDLGVVPLPEAKDRVLRAIESVKPRAQGEALSGRDLELVVAPPAAAHHSAADASWGGQDHGAKPASHRGGFVLWFTGVSGAGKSSLSALVAEEMRARNLHVELLDGDEVRTHLSAGLGFSRLDRDTNVRRIGFAARLVERAGGCAITAAISPYRETRDEQRRASTQFVEVYCEAPLDVLTARDPKGLYRKALAGEIKNFTGIDDPYEAPLEAEVTCHTGIETKEESLSKIVRYLEAKGLISKPVSV